MLNSPFSTSEGVIDVVTTSDAGWKKKDWKKERKTGDIDFRHFGGF
jgi:hypothetical protein